MFKLCKAGALSAALQASLRQEDNNVEICSVHPNGRRIPPSRGVHLRGFHPVRPGHPQVGFESKMERDFISGVGALPELLLLRSQPLSVSFRHAGRHHRYTPDFSLRLSCVPESLRSLGFSLFTYVEIKPLARAEAVREELALKFQAILAATFQPIVLITEEELRWVFRKEARHVA